MKKLHLFLLLLSALVVATKQSDAQCSPPYDDCANQTITMPPFTTTYNVTPIIGVGGSTTLTVRDYYWTPSTGVTPWTGTGLPGYTVFSPTVCGVYNLTVNSVGPNLVCNGDFESGNSGFISDYHYDPPAGGGTTAITQGDYTIGTNTSILGWGPFSGSGRFLMVNGSTTGSPDGTLVVWQETLPTCPSATYEFSYDVASWSGLITAGNFPQLDFYVNSTLVHSYVVSNADYNHWRTNTFIVSVGSTPATIQIIDRNTGWWYNDFCLDNLTFRRLNTVSQSIQVGLPPTATLRGPLTLCVGDHQPTWGSGSTGGSFSSDDPSGFIARIDPISGVATGMSAGTVLVTYTVTNPCGTAIAYTTVNVLVGPTPTLTATPNPICPGTTVTLNALVPPGVSWYSWDDGSTLSPFLTITRTPAVTTTYIFQATKECTSTTTITVTVNPLPWISSVTLSGACSDPCPGMPMSYTIMGTPGATVWYKYYDPLCSCWSGALSTTLGWGSVGLAVVSVPASFTPGVFKFKIIEVDDPLTGCISYREYELDNDRQWPTATFYEDVLPHCACDWIDITIHGTPGSTATVMPGGIPVPIALSGFGILHVNPCVPTTYTITDVEGTCCSHYSGSTITVPVNPLPDPIVGHDLCLYSSETFTDPTPGGSWSSSNPGILDINPSSGLATGESVGAVTVTYTLPTGCYTTIDVNVYWILAPVISLRTTGVRYRIEMGPAVGIYCDAFTVDYDITLDAYPYCSFSPTISKSIGLCASGPCSAVEFNSWYTSNYPAHPDYDYTPGVAPFNVCDPTLAGSALTIDDWEIHTMTITKVSGCGCSWPIHRSSSWRQSPGPNNEPDLPDQISISPNPNNGSFILSGVLANVSTSKQLNIEIIDMLGKTVYSDVAPIENAGLNKNITLGDAVPNGTYIVRIKNDEVNEVIKFTLSR